MTIAAAIAQTRSHSLGDLPRRTAQRFPDKVAIIDGETCLTFGEFDAAVDRMAAGMVASGLEKGDRLALVSHNCWEFAVLDFAAARAGLVLVPINFMLGASEIAYIIDVSGASGLVVEQAMVRRVNLALEEATTSVSVRMSIGGADEPGWCDLRDWTDSVAAVPYVHVADDDPIRMMFTSGTESRPKGALLSSRALMWQYVSCAIDGGMTADDVEVHALPMYHCAQLDCFFGVDLYLGATSIILPSPDPATLLQTVERYSVTKVFAPPTVWISLLRHPDFDRTDLSSLRKGYYGASPMPIEILQEIQRRLPQVRLWNLYGQTEMAPVATILGPDMQSSHPGAAGRPTLNVETRIHDADGNVADQGEIGEIVHRSPQATLGYFNDDRKTADAFREGWFHTGDLGYLDSEGVLFVVDRVKDMIKTGGENVASREVEEVIYQLDSVSEVAVFGVSHPTWVEAVVAVVVPRRDMTLTEEQVIVHVRDRLAGYKTPKRVLVVDELPRNPSGKILKRDLREAYSNVC